MKHPHTRFITLAIGAIAAVLPSVSAQSETRPVVITPPAINDGSNWSRAPFPAARKFDDVKAPDGQAVDKVGANAPAANIEPPTPPARVAILQPTPAPSLTETPGLMPTGRTTVAVSTAVDAATFAPTIRSSMLSSRDPLLADIETRMSTSEKALASMRSSTNQMSAEGRQQFTVASDDVKEKSKALKKSIKEARKASDQNWETARAQLAADYEAYAAALARVDATAGIAPMAR